MMAAKTGISAGIDRDFAPSARNRGAVRKRPASSCAPICAPSLSGIAGTVGFPRQARLAANRTTMQTSLALPAVLCVAVSLLLPPASIAQDTTPAEIRVVHPSVEELAIPNAVETRRESDTREAMCLMIESAARSSDLPLEFFARVIWQESHFQTDAVGPPTRSGQRAQGIAQFMPGTANERRLLDPFAPVQALPKSAEFLNELRNQFGNLGLGAAAYNAGPRRVQDWLAGSGGMPQETRNYVVAITGTPIDDWATASK